MGGKIIKILVTSLALCFAVNAQIYATNWYVDKNVSRSGTNSILNGDFHDANDWDISLLDGEISGGVCNFIAEDVISQTALTVGETYLISVDVAGLQEDSVDDAGWYGLVNTIGAGSRNSYYIYRNGHHEFIITATNATINFAIYDAGVKAPFTATMDNIEAYQMTGNYDGTTWADAWYRLPDVDWDSVAGGDTIYISGSTDSVLYTGGTTISKDITYASEVVITPSWETGHNGDVYFFNADTLVESNFTLSYICNLKFVNIHFWTMCPYDNSFTNDEGLRGGEVNFMTQYDSLNVYEDCHFRNAMTGTAFGFSNGNKNEAINCIMENLTNSSIKAQDAFTIDAGLGGHRFIGNTIIQRNITSGTGAHADVVQFGGDYGTGGYLETVFINNFIWMLTPSRTAQYNGGFYIEGLDQKQRFTFINNILVLEAADSNDAGTENAVPGIWLRGGDPGEGDYSLRLFNNTFVYPSASLLLSRIDTVIAKNNFFIQTNEDLNGIGLFIYNATMLDSVDMDTNVYHSADWTTINEWQGSSYYEFDEWKALGAGHENNSDTTYINPFAYDSVIASYMTPTAYRLAGTNLSYLSGIYPEIMYDILGNPRPAVGGWDIGALEYQGASTPVNGGWLRGSSGKKIYDKNGKVIITR